MSAKCHLLLAADGVRFVRVGALLTVMDISDRVTVRVFHTGYEGRDR
jgi:hypothetical protein